MKLLIESEILFYHTVGTFFLIPHSARDEIHTFWGAGPLQKSSRSNLNNFLMLVTFCSQHLFSRPQTRCRLSKLDLRFCRHLLSLVFSVSVFLWVFVSSWVAWLVSWQSCLRLLSGFFQVSLGILGPVVPWIKKIEDEGKILKKHHGLSHQFL